MALAASLFWALAGFVGLTIIGAGIYALVAAMFGRDRFVAVTPLEKSLAARIEVKTTAVPLWMPTTLVAAQRVLLGMVLFVLILGRLLCAKATGRGGD